MNIKVIRSGSYHPQSQGKVERSHGTWKEKIRHDLLNTRKEGVCDWVSELKNYQQLYNEAIHTSIGISPYECLFGIKPNRVTQRCNMAENEVDDIENLIGNMDTRTSSQLQEDKTVKKRQQNLNILRETAHARSSKSSLKMKGRNLSKFPPSEYEIGDEVLVKYIGKDRRVSRGGTSLKAPKVLEGKVIKTNKEQHRYKIQFCGSQGQIQTDWFRVDMITAKSADIEREKKLQAAKKMQNSKRTTKQSEYLMLIPTMEKLNQIVTESRVMAESFAEEMKEKLESLKKNAHRENLRLDEDNQGGGNCMFHSLSQQLARIGVGISHRRLRGMIVDFLQRNPTVHTDDGALDLTQFVYDYDNWNCYLKRMQTDGEWGDNIVLYAAACLFRIPITVISSIENSRPITITPTTISRPGQLYLGHLAEFHYISVSPESESNEPSDQDVLCQICGLFHSQNDQCNNQNLGDKVMYFCDECGEFHENNNFKCHRRDDIQEYIELSLGKPHAGENDLSETVPLEPRDPVDAAEKFNEDYKQIQILIRERLDELEDEPFGKSLLLNKDERSMVLYHLLKEQGTILQFKRLDDGDFIHINNAFMDLYDDIRMLILSLFRPLVMIFITREVSRWISSLETDPIQHYFPGEQIALLDDDENDNLNNFLRQLQADDENGHESCE